MFLLTMCVLSKCHGWPSRSQYTATPNTPPSMRRLWLGISRGLESGRVLLAAWACAAWVQDASKSARIVRANISIFNISKFTWLMFYRAVAALTLNSLGVKGREKGHLRNFGCLITLDPDNLLFGEPVKKRNSHKTLLKPA